MSLTADAAIKRADNLIDFRRLDEARDVINQAIASEPEIDTLWSTLARIEKQREDYKAAVAAGERAVSLDPTNATAMHVLIAAYELTGKRKKAFATADRMLEQYPDWVGGLIQHAFIYSRGGSYYKGSYIPPATSDKAKASLDRAVELAPENATYLAYAAVYYADLALGGIGQPLMARALELAPTDTEIILLSKAYANEEDQVKRELAVLADDPLSVAARAGFDDKLWSRLSRFVNVPLRTTALVVIVLHLFYGANPGVVGLVTTGLALLAALRVAWNARRIVTMFPEGILRSVLDQNRLVVPSLIVAAAGGVVLLATTMALWLIQVDALEQFYRDAISTLTVTLMAQLLATVAITFTVAHVDVSSMRFADTPAGKVALKRQGVSISDAILGVIGGVVIIVLAVLSRSYTSINAVAAIAVLCLCWSFSHLAANAYRRSKAYRTLWLAIVLYLIAFAVFVVAGVFAYDQLFRTF